MSIDKIIPVLVYRDIAAGQAFLVNTFGFREGRLDRDGAGNVVHAEVHHGNDVIWMHRAELLSEPRDQPYGQREYGVRDPDGHQWWFATPIAAS